MPAERISVQPAVLPKRARLGQHAGPLHAYHPKRVNTQKLYVLRSLPGVGPKLAKVLLAEFGTVEAVIRAEPQDLAAVPGIGPQRAEKILRVLREDPAAYGPVPADGHPHPAERT